MKILGALLYFFVVCIALLMMFVGWALLAVPAYTWILVENGWRPDYFTAIEILYATGYLLVGTVFSTGLIGFSLGRWFAGRKRGNK